MFMHWGLYSKMAGYWKGKKVTGGEWALKLQKLPIEEYRELAKEFNPVKFNADDLEALHATEAPDGASAALAARLAGGVSAAAALGAGAGANHTLQLAGSAATLTLRLDRHDGLDLVPAGTLPGDPAQRLRRGAGLVRELPRARCTPAAPAGTCPQRSRPSGRISWARCAAVRRSARVLRRRRRRWSRSLIARGEEATA